MSPEKQTDASPCRLLQVTVVNFINNTRELLESWKPEGKLYVMFSGEIKHKEQRVNALLVQNHYAGLMRVARKLDVVLGSKGTGNPYLGDAWRSRHTLQNLRVGLRASAELFSGNSEFQGIAALLKQSNKAGLASVVQGRYEMVMDKFESIPLPLFETIQTTDGRKKLESAQVDLQQLASALEREVAPALGVLVSFNANDGR